MGVILIGSSGCKIFTSVNQEKKETVATDTALREIPESKSIEYRYKYIEGVKMKLLGSSSDALELFNQCSKIRPHAPDPYYQMSMIADQLDEYHEAVNYGKKAVQYGPDNKWYRLHLANIYLHHQVLDSARMQYEYLVEEIKTEDMDIIFRLAQLNQKTDRYQEALNLYNQLEQRVGDNERISLLKKDVYAKIGEKEKAYQEIQNLIEKDPDNTQYYGMLAELYATFDDYDRAEKMYDKLFQLDSTNRLGQMSLVKYYNNKGRTEKAMDTYIEKVIPNKSIDFRNKMLIFIEFLREQENPSLYIDRYKTALDSMSHYYSGKHEIQALYADLYLKVNKFKEASEHLEVLVNKKEAKYVYWDQLLSIYSYLGEFRAMYEYGQKGIKLFDRKPKLYLLTGVGALQVDKADSAAVLLEKGIQYIENDKAMRVQFYTQLGEAFHQLENYEKSDRYFKKVLEINPNNKLVLNNYSYYLSLRGEKLNKALGYSQRVIKKEPNNPVYLDTYAWILYKMGEYKKAKKYIEKAIENGGVDDGDIMEHYGDILFKSGNKEKAYKIWEQSKNLGNNSEKLNYKLENKSLPNRSDEN